MSIDLRAVITTPGARLPFRRELVSDRLDFPSVVSYVEPVVGEGVITNNAGALTLRGGITARLRCVCDRCTAEFEKSVDIPLEVPLGTGPEAEENPDYFLLDGDELDIDDLLESGYILNVDSRFLCREDCKGLCPRCGADLNLGPCACGKESDPRLAVLEQLLDDIDQTN